MVARSTLMTQVRDLLGKRALVWAGLRGTDIESLSDLPNLKASISIIGAYRRRSSIEALAYEDLSGTRVDLELWDIDHHLDDDASRQFREHLLKLLRQPSALMPYRSSRFLSSVHFVRRQWCWNLGLLAAHQSGFDHKPWVESALAAEGVPTVGWCYVADEDQQSAIAMLEEGPLILRRSRTSGGQGFVMVDEPDGLEQLWPAGPEGFVSISPYLEDAMPLNVGATVWKDGVTVHYPSLQLIGIDSCVTRPFGYCGNDFCAAKCLDRSIVEDVERHTTAIGHWLRRHGYRGSFGVDYLVHDGQALFIEINPRFQGSTSISAQLSVAAGEACLYLEHLAAMLDLPAPDQRPLSELVAAAEDRAHFVVHWLGPEPAKLDGAGLATSLLNLSSVVEVDLVAHPETRVESGATVLRATTNKQLTPTGFVLDDPYDGLVSGWQRTAAREP